MASKKCAQENNLVIIITPNLAIDVLLVQCYTQTLLEVKLHNFKIFVNNDIFVFLCGGRALLPCNKISCYTRISGTVVVFKTL